MKFRAYIGRLFFGEKEKAREYIRRLLDFAPWGMFPSKVIAEALTIGHPAYSRDHAPLFFVKSLIKPDLAQSVIACRDPWGREVRANIPVDPCDDRIATINPNSVAGSVGAYRVLAFPGSYDASARVVPRDGTPGWNHHGRSIPISPSKLFAERSVEAVVADYFRRHGSSHTDHSCALCEGQDNPRLAPLHCCEICGVKSFRIEWDHHPMAHRDIVAGFVIPLLAPEDIESIGTYGQPAKLPHDHPASVAYNSRALVRPLCVDCHREVTAAQRRKSGAA